MQIPDHIVSVYYLHTIFISVDTMGNKDKYSHLSKRKSIIPNTLNNDLPPIPTSNNDTAHSNTADQYNKRRNSIHNHNKPQINNMMGLVPESMHTNNTDTMKTPAKPAQPSVTPDTILQYLLGNTISTELFLDGSWQQKPILCDSSIPLDDIHTLYNKHMLHEWLEKYGHELQYGVNINLFKYDDSTGKKIDCNPVCINNDNEHDESDTDHDDDDESIDNDSIQYQSIDPQYIQQQYNEHNTSIQHIQPQQYNNPQLYQLISNLESYFGTLVGCNSYITPPQSQGLAPHHDDIDAFIIQCSGSKTWTLYEPNQSQQLACHSSGDLDSSQIGSELMTVTLTPGDVLYMPRGTIHKATTSTDASVHLTLSTYQHYTYYDLLRVMLNNALSHAVQQNIKYRKSLPIGFHQSHGTGAQLQSDIAEQTAIGDESQLNKYNIQQAEVSTSCSELLELLNEYIDIHSAADDICDDYVQNRLPPYNDTIYNGIKHNQITDTTRTYGALPCSGNDMIKLTAPDCIRITVGQLDGTDNNDNNNNTITPDNAEDDELQYVYVSFSTQNQIHTHMSNQSHTTIKRIALPLELAPALITLYTNSNKYIKINTLPLPDECTMTALQLAIRLWSIGVIQCNNHNTK